MKKHDRAKMKAEQRKAVVGLKSEIISAQCDIKRIRIIRADDIKLPRKKGFSLIELVVCLTIISILSMVAIPSVLKRIELKRAEVVLMNTLVINKAVEDVMLQHGAQQVTFGILPSVNKWDEVESLICEGFEGCEVVGYTFNPQVLNDCYYSITTFKPVPVSRLYTKHSTY